MAAPVCAERMLNLGHWVARLAISGGTLLSGTTVWASETLAPPDWGLSADGAHLFNLRARVVWSRCVEGMHWDGRQCVGQALRLDHAGALALARTRAAADGLAWRLPHLKELQHLVTLTAQGSRNASAAFLPTPPAGWCWTATAPVNTKPLNEYRYDNVMRGLTAQNATQVRFLHGWAVNLSTGHARDDALKRDRLLVRLVAPVD
jgi:Protein of unknown function (DUF1566)